MSNSYETEGYEAASLKPTLAQIDEASELLDSRVRFVGKPSPKTVATMAARELRVLLPKLGQGQRRAVASDQITKSDLAAPEKLGPPGSKLLV